MSKEPKVKKVPQLNKFMHPRNPYRTSPNFKELATIYPEFRAHCTYDVTGKVFLDFKKKEALKALTTSLLHKDFNLKVTIPDDRLVPTLPLRLNYLLWIEDLLNKSKQKSQTKSEMNSVIGLDIGTGAVSIYPLLGVKKFRWKFVCTETDSLSFESSKQNIKRNDLEESILLLQNSSMFEALDDEEVIKFVSRTKNSSSNELNNYDEKSSDINQQGFSSSHNQRSNPSDDISMDIEQMNIHSNVPSEYLVDFCVCNPPFFSSDEELEPNHNSKKESRGEPPSVSTGSVQEKVTEGGEIAFITKMIDLSFKYRNTVRIFSTLIGKQSDVKRVIRLISERTSESNICDTEFCQGRTMRWGVAWTFDPNIHLDQVTSKKQRMTQKPLTYNLPKSVVIPYNIQSAWFKLTRFLKDIKIKPQVFKENNYFVGASIRAYDATWRNQRQRRRQLKHSPEKRTNGHSVDAVIDNTPSVQETEETLETPQKKMKLSSSFEDTSDSPSPKISNCSNNQESEPSQSSVPVKNTETAVCLLRCTLYLKKVEGVITMELMFVDGSGKREAMNQLLQYLRNRFNENL